MLHAETTSSRINGWYFHNRDSAFLKQAQEPFASIYEAFFPQLVAFFMRRCNREESEDLAAVTLNNAHVQWHTLKDPEKLVPWLFSIARNLLRNHLRDGNRLKRKVDLVSLETVPAELVVENRGDNPEESLLSQERLGEVIRYIEEEMPVRMRQCFEMKMRFGYSHEAIAQRLKVQVGTVKSQLSQARQRLHEHLVSLGLDRG